MKNEITDLQYNLLFFIFVFLDCITTIIFLFYTNILEINPFVNYIFTVFNLSIGFLIFILFKVIAIELILRIMNYQNDKIEYSGFITYGIILCMSVYIVMNNMILIYQYLKE